jgi:hypothetical protein
MASFWNGIFANGRGNRLAPLSFAIARVRSLISFTLKAFLQPTAP